MEIMKNIGDFHQDFGRFMTASHLQGMFSTVEE